MLTGSGQPAPPRRALRHARSTAKVKVLMTANPSRLGATIPAKPNGSLRTIAALNRSPRPALFAPRVPPARGMNSVWPPCMTGSRPAGVEPANEPCQLGAGLPAGRFAGVSFDVSADAYMRFMGRYSEPLARLFADLAGVRHGQRVLDVGCGPGALTAELVSRLGAGAVRLPSPDGSFDAVRAQLVFHFMADPVAGLREMSRVTRPGGVVAACVWDHGGGRGPLTGFWRAVRELDPAAADESDLAGVRQGQLASLVARAGLGPAEASALTVRVRHASFEQWWEPFTLGVGPAGAYVASLTPERRDALREHCRHRLPAAPVDASATAWAVTCRT